MRKHGWLLLLLGLTLVRGLLYAAVIPPWQAPDETGHFEYTWTIAHHGALPTSADASPSFEQELLSSLYAWRYGEHIGHALPEAMPDRFDALPASIHAQRSRTLRSGRFSLAYVWAALFLLPVRQQALVTQLYFARFASVVLSVGIVWLAFKIFSALLPSAPRLVLLMTGVVVFLPQHTFINSTVGEGPLAELLACWVLWCWIRIFRQRHSLGAWGGIVLGTLLGIWSKSTAVFLLPLDLGLAIWWLVRQDGKFWTRRVLFFSVVGAGVLAVGLQVWGRSQLGTVVLKRLMDGIHGLRTLDLLWVDVRGITFGEALLGTHESFWANFGWMMLPVNGRWYGGLTLLVCLSLMGWLWGRSQKRLPPWALGILGGALVLASGVFVWVSLLGKQLYYQPQGRYLFPVLVPYAFLLVGGLARLFAPRLRGPVLAFLGLGLVFFDTWCLAAYIFPYFYL